MTGNETTPEKTFTKEEVKDILTKTVSSELLIERYIAFHTVSMQRSIQMGDPEEWRQAATHVYNVMMAPPAPAPEPVQEKPDDQPADNQ